MLVVVVMGMVEKKGEGCTGGDGDYCGSSGGEFFNNL